MRNGASIGRIAAPAAVATDNRSMSVLGPMNASGPLLSEYDKLATIGVENANRLAWSMLIISRRGTDATTGFTHVLGTTNSVAGVNMLGICKDLHVCKVTDHMSRKM